MAGNGQAAERDYQFDNIRLLLIFFVVFGHLLESFAIGSLLYRFIYSFHMPVFIFINGYFAKFDPKKTLLSLLLPYLLFQVLYFFFYAALYHNGNGFSDLQFTTPCWLLWYLVAPIAYQLILPFISTENKAAQGAILLASVAVSLLSGCGQGFGYFLSLSRIFAFLPFFVAGFYLRKNQKLLFSIRQEGGLCVSAASFLIPVAVFLFLHFDGAVTRNVLYASSSYGGGYTLRMRAGLSVIAFAWIFFFLRVMPRGKIPFCTVCGANTFSVYLLHGFLVRLMAKGGIFTFSPWLNVLIAALFAIAIVAAFGNKWVGRVFGFVFTFQWVEKIFAHISRVKREAYIDRVS
mgnify:FL=1